MKIEVNLRKRYFIIILSTLIILAGIFTAYALNAGQAPNPGHLLNQVSPPAGCTAGQVITWDGSNLVCSTVSGVSGGDGFIYSSGQSFELQITSSKIDGNRYVFRISSPDPRFNSQIFGYTFQLNQTLVENLCSDLDGCEVIIGMQYWGSSANSEVASKGPYRLFYNNGTHHWRLSETDTNGVDGDGNIAHISNLWNTCFLTDGKYENYVARGDSDIGISLMVWNNYNGQDRECRLIMSD